MSKKGIEDMLSELEMFVDSCKFQPLSSTKIVVPKEELMAMIKELRIKMPGELERCQKIMRNKEGIITDAREQAEQIMSDAAAEASSLVAEHEVVQLAQIRAQEVLSQAEYQANEIIANAQMEAQAVLNGANSDSNAIRIGAMEYTQEKLINIEQIIRNTLIEGSKRYNDMLDLIEESLNTVNQNRQEIETSLYGAPQENVGQATMQSDSMYSDMAQEESAGQEYEEFPYQEQSYDEMTESEYEEEEV